MSDPTEESPSVRLPMTRFGVMMSSSFLSGVLYVAMYGFLNDAGMTEIGPGGSFDAAAYTVAPIAAILAI